MLEKFETSLPDTKIKFVSLEHFMNQRPPNHMIKILNDQYEEELRNQ